MLLAVFKGGEEAVNTDWAPNTIWYRSPTAHPLSVYIRPSLRQLQPVISVHILSSRSGALMFIHYAFRCTNLPCVAVLDTISLHFGGPLLALRYARVSR